MRGQVGAPTPNFLSMNGPDAAAAVTFKESRVNNGRYQTDDANNTTQYTNADVASILGADELGIGGGRSILLSGNNNIVDTSTIV